MKNVNTFFFNGQEYYATESISLLQLIHYFNYSSSLIVGNPFSRKLSNALLLLADKFFLSAKVNSRLKTKRKRQKRGNVQTIATNKTQMLQNLAATAPGSVVALLHQNDQPNVCLHQETSFFLLHRNKQLRLPACVRRNNLRACPCLTNACPIQ